VKKKGEASEKMNPNTSHGTQRGAVTNLTRTFDHPSEFESRGREEEKPREADASGVCVECSCQFLLAKWRPPHELSGLGPKSSALPHYASGPLSNCLHLRASVVLSRGFRSGFGTRQACQHGHFKKWRGRTPLLILWD
jgi:hypothetical protein